MWNQILAARLPNHGLHAVDATPVRRRCTRLTACFPHRFSPTVGGISSVLSPVHGASPIYGASPAYGGVASPVYGGGVASPAYSPTVGRRVPVLAPPEASDWSFLPHSHPPIARLALRQPPAPQKGLRDTCLVSGKGRAIEFACSLVVSHAAIHRLALRQAPRRRKRFGGRPDVRRGTRDGLGGSSADRRTRRRRSSGPRRPRLRLRDTERRARRPGALAAAG